MQYKIVTPVAVEPVLLAEARLQCKVDSDDTSHDAVLEALVTMAREYAEHYTGRSLASQTLEAALPAFPREDYIDLPMGPVSSIVSVTYTDADGVEATMDSGDYALSTYGASRRLMLTHGAVWPTTRAVGDAVRVRYVAGYAAAPKAAKAAMLLQVEAESPLNPQTPAERLMRDRARDELLDLVKLYD